MGEKTPGQKWLEMAEYDLSVADGLLKMGHFSYCVFMCHLGTEKALKGIFQEKAGLYPPKTHNLLYFVQKLDLDLPEGLLDLMGRLNDAHIVTRYPEELSQINRIYNRKRAEEFLKGAREVLAWIKKNWPG